MPKFQDAHLGPGRQIKDNVYVSERSVFGDDGTRVTGPKIETRRVTKTKAESNYAEARQKFN